MNSKLASYIGKQIAPIANAWRGGKYNSDALVSVSKSDEKKGRHIVRVSLHRRAVEKLAWQIGDRISMAVIDGGAIMLKRDNQQGRLLSKATGGSGRAYIRYAVIPDFYEDVPVCDGSQVEIENGRIAFCLE